MKLSGKLGEWMTPERDQAEIDSGEPFMIFILTMLIPSLLVWIGICSVKSAT